MILHLDDRRHLSINAHSGKIWLQSYNGSGTTNPLTKAEAIKLRAALMGAILDLEKAPPKPSM